MLPLPEPGSTSSWRGCRCGVVGPLATASNMAMLAMDAVRAIHIGRTTGINMTDVDRYSELQTPSFMFEIHA